MRVDVDLVVHAKIGKFILIQLSFLLLLNFILDTIGLKYFYLEKACKHILHLFLERIFRGIEQVEYSKHCNFDNFIVNILGA